MFYQLPPVGSPVCLSRSDKPEALTQIFGDSYQAHYFNSGTAALAAAIIAASRIKSVDKPEVILPAYSCPDLISAVIFAGANPVLVDFETDRPWMDLEQLSAKLSTQTVAIIAVNLFGISERMEQLRPLAEQVGAVLIEDSAQAFPMDTLSGTNERDIWMGDLVVLSFGRGKPVSLLGGGAVLCREGGNHALCEALQNVLSSSRGSQSVGAYKSFTFWLKASLYNRMISPRLYWLPQAMPFLHLGETRYHDLISIEGMDRARLSMLPSNVKTYQNDAMTTQKNLVLMLGELDLKDCGITDLPKVCNIATDRRLLRYPLLMEPDTRDLLYKELHRRGLGPSLMYPSVLPEIAGLETLLSSQRAFPAATSFAERLLTLPTHQRVARADIAKLSQLLSC